MFSQSTLNKLQQQVVKPETYLFLSLKKEFEANCKNKSQEINTALKILLEETYETYKRSNLKLSPRYVSKLKAISLLSHFYERSEYRLSKLAEKLELNKQQCLKLLIEANICKLISVKINEQADLISIQNSKIRQRQLLSGEIKGITNGKLISIIQKNSKVSSVINKLIDSSEPVEVKEKKKYQSNLESLLSRFG